MIKFFVLFLYLCFSTVANARVINKVEVSGNTKTKKAAILKWGNIHLGKAISDIDYDEIIEKLNRAYQFNIKKIELKGDTLFIEIEDKWSLFPVPMISQSGNYFSRGLLLYENNFLGRLGTFSPGIFWTNSGLNGLLYFQEDNIITDGVGMKVILLHKADLTEFKRRDRVVSRFETRFDTVVLTPNFHSGRQDHKLGPIYIKKKIYKNDEVLEYQSETFGLYYRHHYNLYRKLPILFDGLRTSYDFFYLPDWKGEHNYQHGGDIQYCLPHYKHFLETEIHYYYSNSNTFFSPKMLGGNTGHRGYDRESVPARENVGFMIQEQLNVWQRVFVTPFYEFNHLEIIDPVYNRPSFNESTVGISLSYYFKKISIPGVILEFARNLDDQSTHVHLNVGLKL